MSMMPPSLEIDIRDTVLSNGSFGPHEIRQMVDVIANDNLQVTVLRDAVQELETVSYTHLTLPTICSV